MDYLTLLLVGGRVLRLVLLPVQASVDRGHQVHEVPHKVQGEPAFRDILRSMGGSSSHS